MLTCGMCGTKLDPRAHPNAFAGAVSVRRHMENLRYVATSLRRRPVLTERGQGVADRLSHHADQGEPQFERLHATAHGLWQSGSDWPGARQWIAESQAQLKPWRLKSLAAET